MSDGTFIAPIHLSPQVKREKGQQYIGIKDKNVTEIYEGDVWKCDTPSFKSTVVFYKGAFLQELIEEPDIWEDWECGEVIGNIHQDKHLLDNP
jgi:hypothetical protein